MVMLWVTDFVILLYRTTHPRIYLRITKTVNCKLLFIGAIPFGGCSYGDMWCCSSIYEVIRRGFSLLLWYGGIYYYMVSVWCCIFVSCRS